MTQYLDANHQIVEVLHALGRVWIVGRKSPNGSHHRLKSPALPPRETAEECQRDLDEYAGKKGWRRVEEMTDDERRAYFPSVLEILERRKERAR